MINKFFNELKDYMLNNGKELNNSKLNFAIYEFISQSIFTKKSMTLRETLNSDLDKTINLYRDKNLQYKIQNNNLILNDNALQAIKVFTKENEKIIKAFKKAINKDDLTSIISEIKNISLEYGQEKFIESIEQLNSSGLLTPSYTKEILSILINSNYESDLINNIYFNFPLKHMYDYNNGDEIKIGNLIGILSLTANIGYLPVEEDNLMLDIEDLIDIIKSEGNPNIQVLFNSKNNNEIYNNYFDKIILPALINKLNNQFEYTINRRITYEDQKEDLQYITDFISKYKSENIHLFDNNKNNLKIKFLDEKESEELYEKNVKDNSYSSFCNDTSRYFNPIIGELYHLNRVNNDKVLHCYTEAHDVVICVYSQKKYEYNKGVISIEQMLIKDLEIDSNISFIKESIESIFQLAQENNSAINLIPVCLVPVTQGIKDHKDNKINKYFQEISEKYKDKVLIINSFKESYLLDMIHSSDLKMNQIIDNLSFIKESNPVSSAAFDRVVSEIKLKDKNNIKFKLN